MYDGIRNAVLDEHDKFTRSNRRARLLCAITAILIPVVAILLAGNTGLVWWMIKLNKDMHVSNGPSTSTESSITLMSNDNHKVATGMALTSVDLPMLVASGSVDELDHLNSINYVDALNMTRFSTVHSYRFTGSDSATVYLNDGAIAHVDAHGVMVLEPPSSVATKGVPADETGVTVDDVCAASGCPTQSCVGFLSRVTEDGSLLHSVECGGTRLWSFPEQFGMTQASGRRLGLCRFSWQWCKLAERIGKGPKGKTR